VIFRRAGAVLLVAMLALPAGAADAPSLEQRSRSFYDLLERGDRERATAVWPDLERDLAAESEQLRARLDRLRDEVIRADGDLQELYRSPRWREPEVQSYVVAYHLAWVRYQAAQLVSDAAQKKSLLSKAVDGFSQFAEMEEVPDVYAESLYGRGLAYMDLGNFAKARDDLKAAASKSRTAAKAKVALAELERRESGKPEPPPQDTDAMLLGKLSDGLPNAAEKPGADKEITELARGLAARGGDWPARVQGVITQKLGDGTPAGVRSSYGLFLLGQLAVDRGRCADVPALATAGAAVKDSGRARWRPELLFLAGGCLLNAKKQAEAAPVLGELVRDFPDSPRAPEAAYLRFRALDVARAAEPHGGAAGAAFEEALTTYLTRYPKADGVAEARYLLGDLYRSEGDCAKASTELAKVPAGAYASRARFGVLECRAGTLSDKTSPEDRAALAKDLRAFVAATPAKGDDAPMVARAALMGAFVAASTTPPDRETTVALLSGFEQKYPAARDLFPRVVELRLQARVVLGQLDDAGHDLDTYLATPADPDRRKTLARLGRELADRARQGDPAARQQAVALAQKVYAVLARDGGDERDSIQLADLMLAAGDPAGARKQYDQVLAKNDGSAEALRGAARAAAAAGDTAGALGYWRRVVEGSAPGGTAWYEARIEQVTLLAGDGRRDDACQLLRSSHGRSTTAGGDALAARLRAMEPEVCR
jgi:tetratricopeptide (TPR) repeat protein